MNIIAPGRSIVPALCKRGGDPMKWALVTGGAGGMGSATAQRLLREGCGVFALDRNAPEPCEGLHWIETDLTDEESVRAAFDEIHARTDRLDCIVHMAGMYDLGSLAEMDAERLKRIFDVNFFSVCRVNRIFLPLLGAGSRILITTSELAPLASMPSPRPRWTNTPSACAWSCRCWAFR